MPEDTGMPHIQAVQHPVIWAANFIDKILAYVQIYKRKYDGSPPFLFALKELAAGDIGFQDRP
jgi:hypothetical protein